MESQTLRKIIGFPYLEVELHGMQEDGKPPVLRCRQLSYGEWEATKGGLPLVGTVKDGRELSNEEALEWHEWARQVVMRAARYIRVPKKNDAGEWEETWERIRIVPYESIAEDEVWIDDFDTRSHGADNVKRVWFVIVRDLRHGGEFESVKDAKFHGGENVAAVDSGDEAGVDSSRVVPSET